MIFQFKVFRGKLNLLIPPSAEMKAKITYLNETVNGQQPDAYLEQPRRRGMTVVGASGEQICQVLLNENRDYVLALEKKRCLILLLHLVRENKCLVLIRREVESFPTECFQRLKSWLRF
jgi:hypothetical protein